MQQRMLSVVDWLAARPLRLGFVLTMVVLLATWFIQLVLLGLVVPQWSDGYGLVPGQDVGGFNRLAMERAALIEAHGWSAWELRPEGWGVSGVLSAWYALTHPAPWAFAPVQALMYGTSGALVFCLIRRLTGKPRWSLLAILPMLLPTAALLYAQPHRDMFIFFGLTLAIFGWWLMAQRIRMPMGKSWILGLSSGMVLVLSGFLIAWVARRFTAEIFLGFSLIMGGLFMVLAMMEVARQRSPASLGSLSIPVAALMLTVAMRTFYAGEHFEDELPVVERSASDREAAVARESSEQPLALKDPPDPTIEGDLVWAPAAWLPMPIDDRLRRLAGARDRFITLSGDGRSAVDIDVAFRSVEDMLRYTPRAMQIGLASPFPHQWLPHEDAPPVRNVYRVAAGLEMVALYALLPFLLYAIWVWRDRPVLWVMLLPALSWVMVYAYTVPVVGALLRYRYGAYIFILALAVAGLMRAIHDYRARPLYE